MILIKICLSLLGVIIIPTVIFIVICAYLDLAWKINTVPFFEKYTDIMVKVLGPITTIILIVLLISLFDFLWG